MNDFYSFLSWQFWLYSLWFLVTLLITIFPTGFLLVNQTKLSRAYKIFLAPIFGMVTWTLQGFVFGFFNLRFLSFFYLGFAIYYLYKLINQNKQKLPIYLKELKKELIELFPKKIILLTGIGSLLQLLSVIGSGVRYKEGITFYWLNAYDGVLHLTFIKELIRHFPPYQPGAYNLFITNYHYLSDLFLAELIRVWHLPISHTFFQYFPVFFAPLLGLIVYLLVFQWTKAKNAAFWAVFFHYFAGDMMYVFSFIFHHNIGTHTDTLDNGIIQLLNMPQAFAKLTFLSGLIFFDQWVKKKDKCSGLLATILLASTVGFKVYFGMAAAFGFSLYIALEIIKDLPNLFKNKFISFKQIYNKHQEKLFLLFLFAFISSCIFFPVNAHAGGIFWTPLEWPKLLLSFDKLNWNDWWLRLQVYEAHHNTKALLFMYGLALTIFLVSIYATRLVGLLFPRYLFKKIGYHNFIFLYPTVFLFSFIGINFLQTSGLHNIFNFLVVALSILSIFSGIIFEHPFFKKNFTKLLLIIIIIFTLPRILLTTNFYISSTLEGNERKIISEKEETALKYLNNKAEKVRLIQTHKTNHLDNFAPYTYLFTDYYSYFGGRGILASHNQPISDRKENIEALFTTNNPQKFATIAYQNAISHIIFQKKDHGQAILINIRNMCLENIFIDFENEELIILRIKNMPK